MRVDDNTKTVLITGATRGLGRAMADELIRLGHRVIGCGRSSTHISALREAYPAPHAFDVVDVSNDDDVANWAHRIIGQVGPPDLLLNNAAVAPSPAPLWNVPSDAFHAAIDINIKGVYHVIRHFAPAMIQRGSGVMVNFSSGWGRSTSPEVAPYCTTKWAIEGLTQALAQDLPDGVAAVAYSPGVIDTDMLRICFGDEAGDYEQPDQWARREVPRLLALTAKDNGRSI